MAVYLLSLCETKQGFYFLNILNFIKWMFKTKNAFYKIVINKVVKQRSVKNNVI